MILLLAAGASSRMRGADKLLEVIDNTPLLRLMAERCVKAGPTRVIIGPGQDARRAVLEGLDVEIVEAEGDDGMAASLRTGVKGLKNQSFMVVLADMPEVMAADLYLLWGLHGQGLAPIVQAASEDGKPGQPVVFAAKFLKSVSKLGGDEGARSILKAHAKDVALIPLKGNRAVVDLDTPEEWAKWRADRSTRN